MEPPGGEHPFNLCLRVLAQCHLGENTSAETYSKNSLLAEADSALIISQLSWEASWFHGMKEKVELELAYWEAFSLGQQTSAPEGKAMGEITLAEIVKV